MNTPDRQLEPGRDYNSAPLHKLVRARLLAEELSDRFKEYRYSLGLEVIAKIDESRHGVRFYARVSSPPPLAVWTSLFADIVHNYRSALDGFAWELANLDGAKPPKPSQLYFPIFDTHHKWEKARATTLSSMPAFVLDRLNQVQPFHAEPVRDGIGLLLHALDIEDKHRAAISIDLKARDKTFWSYSISYEKIEPGHDPQPTRWIGPDVTIFDGMPFLEMTSRFRLEKAEGSDLPLVLLVSAEVHGGKFEKDAFFILRLMDQQVSTSFELVSTGTLRPPGEWLTSVGLSAFSVN
tara:strand:- start:3668 stop:4549 length:882 start_codon:yes stop_codon:yes gene_type:complete